MQRYQFLIILLTFITHFDFFILKKGLCHSFNGIHVDEMYADSPFTRAFMEAHKTDMKPKSDIKNGIGSGENFALDFYLDSQRMQAEGLAESQLK